MNILLFSPNEPRKNNFVQYHGFLLARRQLKDLILETNVITDQPRNFINNHGWVKREIYEKIIRNSKLALCVHPFESLDYQVVEIINLGTIPIISPTVRDNLNLPIDLVVDNVDSPIAISKKIIKILELPEETYNDILELSQEAIKELAQKHNKELKIVLKNSFL